MRQRPHTAGWPCGSPLEPAIYCRSLRLTGTSSYLAAYRSHLCSDGRPLTRLRIVSVQQAPSASKRSACSARLLVLCTCCIFVLLLRLLLIAVISTMISFLCQAAAQLALALAPD